MITPVTTTSGRPAHIWDKTKENIFGAWLGDDGWWVAAIWSVSGQLGVAPGPLDLFLRGELERCDRAGAVTAR